MKTGAGLGAVSRKQFLTGSALLAAGAVGAGLAGCSSPADMGATSAQSSAALAELTAQIEDLMAKDAIREKLCRYSRSMDRIDAQLGYSVFADDSKLDYGSAYQGDGKGFVDFCVEAHKGLLATSHQMTDITIHVNGDKAGSETYGWCTMTVATGENEYMLIMNAVRYNDKWEKRDGDWLIVERTTSGDINVTLPYTMNGEQYNTARDTSDPSYKVL